MNAKFSRLFLCLILLMCFLAQNTIRVHAAPAYKVVVSVPGIAGKAAVWLAIDDDLMRGLQGGGFEPVRGEPPTAQQVIYQLDWYWGRCWANKTPCTQDPGGFVVFRSLYYFDPVRKQGGVFFIDKPGIILEMRELRDSWLRTSESFDQAMQRALAQIKNSVWL